MPIRSWIRSWFLILSDDDERLAFHEAAARQNVGRIFPLAIATLIVELCMFVRVFLQLNEGSSIRPYAYMALYLIMSLMMCFALVLLRLYRNDPESGIRWAGAIAVVGAGAALLWAAVLTLIDLSGAGGQASALIAMQYLAMVVFILQPRTALALLAGTQAVFLVGAFVLLPDPAVFSGVLINTGVNAILAWVVSRIMCEGYLRQFRATRTIHEKNAQLKKLNQVLGELSITDPLTMLMNRRHFDEIAEREWRRACRENQRLTIAIADVDDFKPFNDMYGHQAGDECLYKVAGAMRAELRRATDTLARFGGEEFIILLRSDSELKDEVTLRRVKDAVESLAVPHAGSRAAQTVTISIGACCTAPCVESSIARMVALADKALYEAKARGRNRLLFHADAER